LLNLSKIINYYNLDLHQIMKEFYSLKKEKKEHLLNQKYDVYNQTYNYIYIYIGIF